MNNSQKPSKKRFFIALLPPKDVQKEATKIKKYFKDIYNSKAALKSPPHVTLQPPFEWEIEDLPNLIQALNHFSQSQQPFFMTLNGFSAFKPRVIYIDVLKTSELLSIQKSLMSHLESSLNLVHSVSKSRPFAPHLTVAFRDLTKKNFYQAWPEFKDKEFYYNFMINEITLLIHNGSNWDIHSEYCFNQLNDLQKLIL
ncbi:putative 2',5' RNA ligase [Crocosphaera subtropica ATCC 51142]|uniref:2',5' RNA ligase n=1 Tax=Crocosphaera subtropica (strain ATCC 51142 / BH68) TaxID=43989 RepID=B1WZ18_CROS5|nr:2'-5' RNA ligase family protein [Crocosphaera subtropica]ACB52782.1 putative 2',5' RNA ligase [Crocosphaera subtropica ATCC 51142]